FHIIGFMTPRSLVCISMTCYRLWMLKITSQYSISFVKHHPAVEKERRMIRRQLICFHSKAHFEEDDTILGIGINVRSYKGKIKDISSPLDLLSFASFTEGVRRSVWN